MSRLRVALSQYWLNIQGSLFPWLKAELGELTERQQRLVMVLETVRIEEFLGSVYGLPGRPPADRTAIARAFVAKMVYDMASTRVLMDRLASDRKLRRICGWERRDELPGEWTFSRTFAEFAAKRLPERVHEALIRKSYAEELVGHISRDSTAIVAREKPVKKVTKTTQARAPMKRGRPRKGDERVKEPTRLERQSAGMSLKAMIEDLPKVYDVGTKKNSHGYKSSWIGYKLHIDAADGGIPVSCLPTSASSHDSQSAIPLAVMTSRRVTNLYDLMDSGYDAPAIHAYGLRLGHVPLIDIHPHRNTELKEELADESKRRKATGYRAAEEQRYNERTTVEPINGRLKDEFGGRRVRVRGHAKVMCHLMFGMLALSADQLAGLRGLDGA